MGKGGAWGLEKFRRAVEEEAGRRQPRHRPSSNSPGAMLKLGTSSWGQCSTCTSGSSLCFC
jgi:hypothetical protein